MSCDHQLIATHVIDLLEDRLPPVLKARCEKAMAECEHCRGVYAQAQVYAQMAGEWEEQEVPEWNRARHVALPVRRYHNSWLSWGALAASIAAIMLVVLRVEVSTANGLMISFGGRQTDAIVQQQVAEALARYAAEQQTLLDTRFTEFTRQQATSTELLFSRWQDANRVERRQELNYLLTGWQNQRVQDQRAVSAQLSELANDQIENNQYLNVLMQTVAQPGRRGL
jgi:hypothetical protein